MDKIIEKLKNIQENPGFYKGLTDEEQAELFLFLLTPKPLFKKKPTVKLKDGYTPVPDVDYLSLGKTMELLNEMKNQINQIDARLNALETLVAKNTSNTSDDNVI